MTTISNSTISNSVFKYSVRQLSITNAVIDRCTFNGSINVAAIVGDLIKCQFEGLSQGIEINGSINDMTIQVDIYPTAALYVQNFDNSSQLTGIARLVIDSVTIPRLAETLHKDCYITDIKPNNNKTFIVQVPTDDTNPSGTIIMFYPGYIPQDKTLADVIPKGYALCDGLDHGGVTTPDLQGKFIRGAASKEDIGDHVNPDLTDDGEGTRHGYLQIHDYNLPPHIHSFEREEVNEPIRIIGNTDEARANYYYETVTTSSDTISTGGDGSATVFNMSSNGHSDYSTHFHSIDITTNFQFSFTPQQQTDTFENTKIFIEPDAYALVFIMKL